LDDYESKAKTIQAKIKEIESAFSLPENSSDAKMKDLNSFYEAEKKALTHIEKEMEVILEEIILLED
jgi:transcription elongation GreA/GreB family factor